MRCGPGRFEDLNLRRHVSHCQTQSEYRLSGPWLRPPQDIVVRPQVAARERLHQLTNRIHNGRRLVLWPPAGESGRREVRTDKCAVRIDWKRRDVRHELQPAVALKQVPFDVRRVEGCHRLMMALQIAANSAKGFVSREVAHQRNDSITRLVPLQDSEVLL